MRRVHADAAAADGVGWVHHLTTFGLLDNLFVLVVNNIIIAVQQRRAFGAVNQRAARTAFHRIIIAAPALPTHRFASGKIPCDGLGVGCFPIILKSVTSAIGTDAYGPVHAQSPAADIYFMRAVVERFAGAVNPAPMPVVMNEIVNEWTARSWTLPEIIIQPFGNRRWFAVADGRTTIRIPTFAKISFAD